MALRALMREVKDIQPTASGTADEFTWTVTWFWFDKDQGLAYQVDCNATILWTDTGAQIIAKLIDAVVAEAVAQGQTLARTSTRYLAYTAGS